jgi:signal transduction histidine kinase
MSYMSRADDWYSEWADTGRRIAAVPHAPVVAGTLLGLAAVAEAVARAAGTRVSVQSLLLWLLAVSILALSTTVPLVFLGPVAAAVAVSAASVLSLALFHTLTVAGLAAELIVLYRLGRNGPQRNSAQLLGLGLAAPFLVLTLAGLRPTGSEAGVLVVLLAALTPAAALAGIAQRARGEALVHSTARQAIAGTLLEHTARGERARIARELHDVVATTSP